MTAEALEYAVGLATELRAFHEQGHGIPVEVANGRWTGEMLAEVAYAVLELAPVAKDRRSCEDLCNEIAAHVPCGDGVDVVEGARRLRAQRDEALAEAEAESRRRERAVAERDREREIAENDRQQRSNACAAVVIAQERIAELERARDFAQAQRDELKRLLRDRDNEITRLNGVILAEPDKAAGERALRYARHAELNGEMLRTERATTSDLRERIDKLQIGLGRAGVALSRAGDEAEYAVAFAVLEGHYTALDAKEG